MSAKPCFLFVLLFPLATLAAVETSPPQPLPLREHPQTPGDSLKFGTPILQLHVSPKGSDSAAGSAKQPFVTLEQARDELRSLRQKGALPLGPIEVVVHGGEYNVNCTFALAQADSGSESSQIIFTAAKNEKPAFRGGTRLDQWRHISESDGYPLLPDESRAKVWVADLVPNAVANLLPLKLGGFASGNGFSTHPAHELFFNGKAMQLARGPNEGFLHVKDVAVKDGTKGYDREGSKIGKLYVEDPRLKRWVQEPDLLLYGYWFWDWADSYERVASIDPDRKLVTLSAPFHTYGYRVGAPFYAVNALSELDQKGEWYLDRKAGRVLFYAPSDPNKATVELSQFAAPMVSLENASWISFKGFTWELGSADAIQVRGGTKVTFAGCTVRHFAGNGIEIHSGTHHTIRSCDIYSLGRGGTTIIGGNRKTLETGGHVLENCHIYDLSRIDHTYTPAAIVDGVGHRIAHNRMHDVRSSALRVGGNNHIVEYNEIFNAVTESDDQGGVDMFGNPTFRGNVYRYNYFHHIGNWRGEGDQPKCGQAGIRLDDAICGTHIYGNVFERCSAGKLGFGGVQIHGGKDNVVQENLFIDCAAAVSCSPWDAKRWREYVAHSLEDKEIDSVLYKERYPELRELADNANHNSVHDNVAWRCGELLRRAPKNLENTNNSMFGDSQFAWDARSFKGEYAGLKPIPFAEIGLYRDPGLRER